MKAHRLGIFLTLCSLVFLPSGCLNKDTSKSKATERRSSARTNSSQNDPLFYTSTQPLKAQNGKGSLILMGGGKDVTSLFESAVKADLPRNSNVLVLRESRSDGYNGYFMNVLGSRSVTSAIIDSKDQAKSEKLSHWLDLADFIWLSGGDQSRYIEFFSDTQIQSKIRDLYDRGGIIGGTSAGMATLSNITYSPSSNTKGLRSDEVVSRHDSEAYSFEFGFLKIPGIPLFLTDTHFRERDRMLRVISFVDHISKRGARDVVRGRSPLKRGQKPLVIAADEGTALYIKSNDSGAMVGEVYSESENGAVYVLNSQDSELNFSRQKFEINGVKRYRLQKGDRFDFNKMKATSSKGLALEPKVLSLSGEKEIEDLLEDNATLFYD